MVIFCDIKVRYYLPANAWETLTATATVVQTIGLLPIPIKPKM